MRNKLLIAIVGVILALAMVAVHRIDTLNDGIQFKKIELQDNSAKLKLLDSKYQLLNQELDKTGADKAKIEQQLKDLQKERDELNAKLQAKIDAKNKTIAQATLGAVGNTASAQAPNCGSDPYMAYIYQKESGCRTDAVNSIGCRGIGQACPGSKLPCGADFACQNAWFTNYAISRYGSTYSAYQFWLANHWY